MSSNNQALLVPPRAAPGTNDIRAVKPPLELSHPSLWLWIVLGLLAAAAAYLWHRRRHRAPLPAPPPSVPPHLAAKERLRQALLLLHDPRLFCIHVSAAIRFYLEERFHFHAPERTTEEFLLELQQSPLLAPDQKESLADFLQRCDLVKFARHEPPETELRDLHESAARLVDETQFETVDPALPATKP